MAGGGLGVAGGRRSLLSNPMSNLLPLVLLAVLTGGLTGCAEDLDRVTSLQTTLAGVDGVSEAEVHPATTDSTEWIAVVLDHGLDTTDTLAVVSDVTAAAAEAGSVDYRLEVRRSLTDDDVLVVDETFAGSRSAEVVTATFIRLTDALLGEISYDVRGGSETIAVASGGGIGHDVAESARIGDGSASTTWRFEAGPATFVVAGRIGIRDAHLFDRVQRTVSSSVLPLPAVRWRLERQTTQVVLDLDVRVPGGGDPDRISVERWGEDVRPLAVAAVRASHYPGRSRWLTLTDVAGPGPDTFASWRSGARPVRGRDPHLRGWDAWWQRLAVRLG